MNQPGVATGPSKAGDHPCKLLPKIKKPLTVDGGEVQVWWVYAMPFQHGRLQVARAHHLALFCPKNVKVSALSSAAEPHPSGLLEAPGLFLSGVCMLDSHGP